MLVSIAVESFIPEENLSDNLKEYFSSKIDEKYTEIMEEVKSTMRDAMQGPIDLNFINNINEALENNREALINVINNNPMPFGLYRIGDNGVYVTIMVKENNSTPKPLFVGSFRVKGIENIKTRENLEKIMLEVISGVIVRNYISEIVAMIRQEVQFNIMLNQFQQQQGENPFKKKEEPKIILN